MAIHQRQQQRLALVLPVFGARLSGDAQQLDRHQDSPGQRLSRHARDHARHRKDEVKGLCGFSWSSLKAQRPDWLKSGFIRVLVQEHDKATPTSMGWIKQ